MDEWCRIQTETYLLVGILFPIFIGFLIGSAVVLLTGSVYAGIFIGAGICIWCWVFYFRKRYA